MHWYYNILIPTISKQKITINTVHLGLHHGLFGIFNELSDWFLMYKAKKFLCTCEFFSNRRVAIHKESFKPIINQKQNETVCYFCYLNLEYSTHNYDFWYILTIIDVLSKSL